MSLPPWGMASRAFNSTETRQEAHGAAVALESLFFFAELAGMGSSAAALESHGMLYMQHLVIQHITNHITGHSGLIKLAVEDDLVQCRIETP